jgi:hypothetical protein
MSQFHVHETKLIMSAWLYLHFLLYVKLWMMFAIKSQSETASLLSLLKLRLPTSDPLNIGASHLMTLGQWKKCQHDLAIHLILCSSTTSSIWTSSTHLQLRHDASYHVDCNFGALRAKYNPFGLLKIHRWSSSVHRSRRDGGGTSNSRVIGIFSSAIGILRLRFKVKNNWVSRQRNAGELKSTIRVNNLFQSNYSYNLWIAIVKRKLKSMKFTWKYLW